MKLLGSLLLMIGGTVAIGNWAAPLLSRRSGRHISMVPLIGAGLLALGLLCLDVPSRYLWIPIVADLGTLMLLFVIPLLFYEAWALSSFCRTHQFLANDRGREIRIDLFRSGRALIRCALSKTAQEHFPLAPIAFLSRMAQWSGDESAFELYGYCPNRRLMLSSVDGIFEATEVRNTEDTDPAYLTLDGIRFTDSRDA